MTGRSLEFVIAGDVETHVLVEEVVGADGGVDLKFTVTVLETGAQADLRGLFWDVTDESLLPAMHVVDALSPDATDSRFAANGVTDLGNGANMQGALTSKGRGFDAGVEIGTQGIGKDDIDQTSFVVSGADGEDLTLEAISGMRFGVRLTSVGPEGAREDSLKLAGQAPHVPVANDDAPFYVEYGDVAFADVAANDTDGDGNLDPTTIVVSGADLGTATESGGLLRYEAISIAYDMVDSSAADAMTYTIADTDGIVSSPADVTALVIDPMRETNEASSAGPNGQVVGMTLSTEDRTYNTSSFAEIDILSGSLDQTVNVSFVIDGSGSVSGSEYAQQRLAVQNALDALRLAYADSVAEVNVQLVQFATGAQSASYDLYAPALDDVAVGTPISVQTGGVTNYEAALDQAVAFFSGKGGQDNFLLFASDGEPNAGGGFLDEVAQLEALGVSRTAVGFGSISAAGVANLNQIDDTGGAEVVPNAAALGDVFADSPLFPAELLSFSLTVNGVDQGLGVGDLTDLGGGDYSFDGTLLGLANGAAGLNEVTATAGFDFDSDGVVDEFRIATTVIEGTDGTDVLFV